MSLSRGDHLRIQRNGKLVEPEEEAYHEFEVLGYSVETDEHTRREHGVVYAVRLKVVQ